MVPEIVNEPLELIEMLNGEVSESGLDDKF